MPTRHISQTSASPRPPSTQAVVLNCKHTVKTMLKFYSPKVYLVILASFSLLLTGCTESRSSLAEDELKDLSAYAVGLNNSNTFDYYPLIEAKIPQSHNPELHRDVLDIAMVLNALAMKYIEQTGGIADNGTFMNPNESGEKGARIYKELKVEARLTELLTKAKAKAGFTDKDLMQVTEYIVQKHFLSQEPYFDQQKLTQRPLSVLSLELLLLENKLCAVLLNSLSANKK